MAVDTTAVPGRLRDSRAIAAVLRGGQRRAGRLVVLHVLPQGAPSPDGERSDVRLAVVASRKVGPAVSRNRAKRLLREAAQRVAWAPGVDVVLVARNGCASSTMAQVLDEVQLLADDLALVRSAA